MCEVMIDMPSDHDGIEDDDCVNGDSGVDDEELSDVNRKIIETMEDDALAAKVENGDGTLEEGRIESEYEDSDNPNSPCLSEDENADGGEILQRFPQFNSLESSDNVELEVGMTFSNKAELREAYDHYRIVKGLDLKVIKSDPSRFQAMCNSNGCRWRIWATPIRGQQSFQIKTIDNPHSCLSLNFGKGKRKMSTSWLAVNLVEIVRISPQIKLRELKEIVLQKFNFEPTLSMFIRARDKALALIKGDHEGEFPERKRGVVTFKRRPEAGEERARQVCGTSGKMSRKGYKQNCSNCGQTGHKKLTCTNRPMKLRVTFSQRVLPFQA